MQTSHRRNKVGDLSSQQVVLERGYVEDLEGQIAFLKKENEQLNDLNRKLTDEVTAYQYKDSLKEAQYIIEGQFNQMLAPQKYKYLL